jgi:hypothetical protein
MRRHLPCQVWFVFPSNSILKFFQVDITGIFRMTSSRMVEILRRVTLPHDDNS